MLLNQAVRANPAAEWPFEHGMAMTIIEQVGQAVEPLLLQTRSFALVASPICRSALSRLVRATFPDVAVISYLEIPATKQTEIVATIGAEVPRLAAGPGAPMEDQVHENRSEEHTSELQSLMRTSYAVFCLKNKKKKSHK